MEESAPTSGMEQLAQAFGASMQTAYGENTLIVQAEQLIPLLEMLRDDPQTRFEQLIDLCGVDFSDYPPDPTGHPERFAVIYHLLSVSRNDRIRVIAYVAEDRPVVPSAIGVFACADWYEREAFDLFGILFDGHPDLRRLLTDYGFIGHPFRKDFPLSGHVEMRFDEKKGRVVYEPVSIEPRVTVPRIIR
jgi:NADH-quinone oxidoreductase subunit C|tara:strand:- start:311 stop:880 length:570 start_codon:yes stop_codon:yes gene_type:complete